MTSNLTVTLDWISFTLKELSHEAARWISIYASPKEAISTAPVKNYTDAYKTKDGIIYCWNTRRAEMGHHIVISGSALRNLWQHYELDQRALVQAVLNIGGRVSRFDLAKDLQDVAVDFDSIYRKAEKGDYTGTAQKHDRYQSDDGGDTIYIGSRESEKFIRIYNKSAESKLQDKLWSRFEVETKGMVARSLASLSATTDDWSGIFDNIARKMFEPTRCKAFELFFREGVVPIGLPKLEKHSDREAWIEKQVTPAVVKHYIENPNSRSVKLLRTMLEYVKTDTVDLQLWQACCKLVVTTS